jgi:hypothetical protein
MTLSITTNKRPRIRLNLNATLVMLEAKCSMDLYHHRLSRKFSTTSKTTEKWFQVWPHTT